MAQQFFKQSEKDDDPFADDQGWSPTSTNERSTVSQNAEHTPSALADQEARAGSPNNSSPTGSTQTGAEGGKKPSVIPNTDLRESEEAPFNYRGDAKKKVKGRSLSARKRAGIAGAAAGAGLLGGMFGLTLISGPFEFIHIAQLLMRNHFANLQNASDTSMGRIYRFIDSAGDASDTRLGWLERRYKRTMLGQLSDKGLAPATGKFATLDGWNFDTTKKGSPYEGLDEDALRANLIENGVPEGSFDIATNGKGILSVTPKKGTGLNFLQTYKNQKGMLQYAVTQADETVIPDAIRTRILGKAYGISWHPMVQLKGSLNNTVNNALLKAWQKATNQRVADGQSTEANEANATDGEEQSTDQDGKTSTTEDDGGITNTKAGFSKTLSSIASSPGGKIAGGLAAAVAVVCLVKTVSDNIGNIRFTNTMLPFIRKAALAITMGQQSATGVDSDLSEEGIESQNLTDSNGQNWSVAKTARVDAGDSSPGVDLDSSIKQELDEKPPSWLSWTDNSAVGALCSTGGQILSGIVSFGLGIFSGELASTAIGAVAGALVEPEVVSEMSDLAAGTAIDLTKVAGPKLFNVEDYGSGLLANAQAVQLGGTKMGNTLTASLDGANQQANKVAFQSQSLAYRLFNPYDDDTLVSKVIDNTSPNTQQNVSHLASSLLNIGRTLAALPLNLFSSVAHADAPVTYQYPFAAYGISPQDLTNPLIENPNTNAGDVAKLLDSNNQNGEPDYISKANQCFNVSIQKVTETDGTQDWDVIPNPTPINLYNNTSNTNGYYNSDDCANPADSGFTSDNWLRIRFFVLYTGLMEGWACEHGDGTSCQNDGMDDSGSGTATGSLPSQLGSHNPIVRRVADTLSGNSKRTTAYAGYA